MNTVKKIIEQLLYSIDVSLYQEKFGFSPRAYDLKKEIDILRKKMPANFKEKKTVDLGCGDGYVISKLKEVLKPKKLICVDLSSKKVNVAQKRGLKAKKLNISEETIKGEVGILWDVIHHLQKPEQVLKKLISNFDNLIIREDINTKRFFELGDQYTLEKLIQMFRNVDLKKDNYKFYKCKKNRSVLVLVSNQPQI